MRPSPMTRALHTPWEGVLYEPEPEPEAGVLVLAGSSGRVDHSRARLLASHGLTALAIRWFGGPGQPPGICEVPLETFTAGVDLLLTSGVRRVGILGVSKGAEAALLTAVYDPRVNAVVAVSPSAYAWSNVGPGLDRARRPQRSCWTWRGAPLPFTPMDDSWESPPCAGPVPIRGWYEQSAAAYPDRLAAAAIPIERARADVLLVAGGDDAMWPSLAYAEHLAERRRAAGHGVRLVTRADAGHRPRFPGEAAAPPSDVYDYGGSPYADAALGAEAWPWVVEVLTGGS